MKSLALTILFAFITNFQVQEDKLIWFSAKIDGPHMNFEFTFDSARITEEEALMEMQEFIDRRMLKLGNGSGGLKRFDD